LDRRWDSANILAGLFLWNLRSKSEEETWYYLVIGHSRFPINVNVAFKGKDIQSEGGLVTHVVKRPALQESATVGNTTNIRLLDVAHVGDIIVSRHVARAAIVATGEKTRINVRENCIYSVWALRKHGSIKASYGIYR
jgi:hypothetical protein